MKLAILPKIFYKVSAILIKTPVPFFKEIKKQILKDIWRHKRPRKGKEIRKLNTAGGITSPDFK